MATTTVIRKNSQSLFCTIFCGSMHLLYLRRRLVRLRDIKNARYGVLQDFNINEVIQQRSEHFYGINNLEYFIRVALENPSQC